MKAAKTYTAPHAVYVDLRLIPAGEEFTTDSKPGKEWVAVPAKAAAKE